MGSVVELLVWATDPEPLADWAWVEIERCEASWSRFRPQSDLCALNARAGRGPLAVSPLLWDALERARIAHRDTDGWFDPTVLGSLIELGYNRSFPFGDTIGERRDFSYPVPGFAKVQFDGASQSVEVPAGCGIDLGGIGKGLAADRVIDGLLARGAISACVGMGGDVRVGGPGPDSDDAWDIAIEDPRDGRRTFRFPLVDEALAQSSTLVRRWRHGDRDVHHLIDPQTGDASRSEVLCAVVTEREAWRAETLAKAALLAGVDAGIALIERAGADGWLLCEDGVVHATRHVADLAWSNPPRRETEAEAAACSPH